MENVKSIKWISQNLYTFDDPNTGISLILKMESGIIVNDFNITNYFPVRISILLKDNRIQSNTKYQYDINLSDLILFKTYNEKLFNDNTKNVFKENSKIILDTFVYGGGKKHCTFSFVILDGKPNVVLSIGIPKQDSKQIVIDTKSYTCIKTVLSQVLDNYAILSSNMLTTCSSERVVDEITKLKEEINSLKSVVHQNSQETTELLLESIKSKEVDPEVFDVSEDEQKQNLDNNNVQDKYIEPENVDYTEDEQIEVESEVNNDISSKFNDMLSNITDTIDLGLDKIYSKFEENDDKEVKDIKNTNSPFIGNFLNNDITRLTEWSSAYLNASEKTDSKMFTPISNLINNFGLYRYNDDYVLSKAELLNNVIFRKDVVNYINKKEFPKSKYWCYKLNIDIDQVNSLFNMTKEILATYIIYHLFVNIYVNKLENVNSKLVISYNIALHFLKKILFSFVVSSNINLMNDDNINIYVEDVNTIFRKMIENNTMVKLEEQYNTISNGGKFKLTPEMFDKVLKELVNVIRQNKVSCFTEITVDEMIEEEGLTQCVDPDSDNVKSTYIKYLQLKDNSKKTLSDNNRLRLFNECVEKFMTESEKELYDKNTIYTYDKLTKFFKKYSLNEDIQKIKRILDMNPEFENRAQVIKEYKQFKEEPSVTETRLNTEERVTSSIEDYGDDNFEDILAAYE